MSFLENISNLSLRIIKSRMHGCCISLEELGCEYFLFQPDNCDCIGPPEEQREWHKHHLRKCVKDYSQIKEFESDFLEFIEQKAAEFFKKKERVWARIEQKAREIGYRDKFGILLHDKFGPYFLPKGDLFRCTNSQLLKAEEERQIAHLENLDKTWQEQQEEVRKQQQEKEWERIRKEQEKAREEEVERKKQEEELKKNEEKLKKKFQEEIKREEKKRQKGQKNKKPALRMLKKFENVPNFNTKEKIITLINSVKDNPNFLQRLKENNIQDLVALITDKSPQEIIITIKRFEYDKDKDKDKKIRKYYRLRSNEALTDEQINNYLYQEAIGQITSPTENPNKENNKFLILLIIGLSVVLFFIFLRIFFVKRKKSKKY